MAGRWEMGDQRWEMELQTEVAVISSPNEFLLLFIRHRMASNQSIYGISILPIGMRSYRGGTHRHWQGKPMEMVGKNYWLSRKTLRWTERTLYAAYCTQFCAIGDLRHSVFPDETFNYPLSVSGSLSLRFPFSTLHFPFSASLHSAIPIKLSYSCLGNFPRIKTCGHHRPLVPLVPLLPFSQLNWANKCVQFGSRAAQQKLYLNNLAYSISWTFSYSQTCTCITETRLHFSGNS